MDPVTFSGTSPLQRVDPEIYDLIREKMRQFCGIELSPSEIFTSSTVIEELSYALTEKNSNGMPSSHSCYGGSQLIDAFKDLASTRALQAFGLDPACWGVIIQAYSGSPVKVATYTAFLEPHSHIMGLNLPSGPLLTHGYDTSGSKKISFESLPFDIDPFTGCIDYDKLEEKALDFRPQLIICGSSTYPRDWDYTRFRSIANKCSAFLLCDMANISGLVATKEAANPFEYCDVVTTTTTESSRALMAGMIFYRKSRPTLYYSEGKTAVFPSLQGGLQEHQIGVLAVSLKQAMSPEFNAHAKQVKANAVALANYLMSKGYKLVTGGTDNHLVLWDLRPLGLTGNKVEKFCNRCGITLSKNAVFGYSSVKEPRGVLVGTHAMTRRGFVEKDFGKIGEFLHRAVTITSTIQKLHGKRKRMKDFDEGLENNEDIKALQVDVEKFSLLH